MKQKKEICRTETTFCIISAAVVLTAVLLDTVHLLPRLALPAVYPVQFVAGLLLLLFAVHLYCDAVIYAQTQQHCADCPYYCGGVYARCRNPRCAAALFFAAGVFLIDGNVWLVALLPVLRVFLSVLMHRTEQKLEVHCGAAYQTYKHRVNRCVPFMRKRKAVPKV